MKILSKIIATFFGIGYIPLAPGTVASFLVILLYRYHLHKWHWQVYLGFTALIFIFGSLASSAYSQALNKEDPRSVVIDEVLGQLIVLFRLPPAWPVLFLGFLVFRILDILKPFVIKKSENFPRGWGIMMDDMVSGVCAGIVINLYVLLI
ncbi:MAG: phosphatidylglycerophosphatase A [Candidatus Aminicenantes bacterium]|jgi:phosphatidylglycerophosphatase A